MKKRDVDKDKKNGDVGSGIRVQLRPLGKLEEEVVKNVPSSLQRALVVLVGLC